MTRDAAKPPEEDAELIDRARGGDRAALESLVVRYQDRVYRFGLKMCGDPGEAQDVVQDTMMAMARTIRTFRGDASLGTWLYAIARNFCVRHRRHGKFEPSRVESLESVVAHEGDRFTDPHPPPDDVALAGELSAALDAAIADLDDDQREVLLLRDVEGLTAPEVAEVMGLGVTAVKSRLHRARLFVRARVAPLLLPAAPLAAAAASCPDVIGLLSRHLEGDISKEQCAEMERHVEGCRACHAACESLRRTLALCRSVDAPVVPEPIRARLREQVRALMLAPESGTA